jgi:hypothetical protein
MKKEHAEHNEDACNYLLKSGKFNDWVVTTAFYSALHYVQYELFPMEHHHTFYDNFNSYYDSLCDYLNNRPSKHQIIIELVHTKLPNCIRFYRWLHNECFNARYKNYKVTCDNANMAMKYLCNIKRQLNKL